MTLRRIIALFLCGMCSQDTWAQENDPFMEISHHECQYVLIQGEATPKWMVSVNPDENAEVDLRVGTGRFSANMLIPEGKRLSLHRYGAADWQRISGTDEIDFRPLWTLDSGRLCSVTCLLYPTHYVTDRSLKDLSRFRSLKRLGVRLRRPLDDPTVLTRFEELEALVIHTSIASEADRDVVYSCSHNSRVLDAVTQLKSLRMLELYCAMLGADDIDDISKMTSLTALSLPAVKDISDDDLLRLQEMPRLSELSIQVHLSDGHSISDEAVLGFAEMHTLKWLDLTIPGISKKAFRELERRMPNTKVHWAELRSNE